MTTTQQTVAKFSIGDKVIVYPGTVIETEAIVTEVEPLANSQWWLYRVDADWGRFGKSDWGSQLFEDVLLEKNK